MLWGQAPRHIFGCCFPITLNKPSGWGVAASGCHVPSGPGVPVSPAHGVCGGTEPQCPGCGLPAAVCPNSLRTEAGPRARRHTWGSRCWWRAVKPATCLGMGPSGSRVPKPGPHLTLSSSTEITPVTLLQGTRPRQTRSRLCSKTFFAFSFLTAYFRLFLLNARVSRKLPPTLPFVPLPFSFLLLFLGNDQ